jgi:agmatine deiminase
MEDTPKSSSLRRDNALCPAQLGYRMPAEWEPHQCTWIAWPHNHETWPGQLAQVEACFVRIIEAIAKYEPVRVIVNDERMERHARLRLRRTNTDHVQFHHFYTNDAWVRDYGATFVCRESEDRQFPPLVAVDWGFNSWGEKYPPYDADRAIARKMAQAAGMPCVSGGIVLEGGAIDTNGSGVVMTTPSCVLHPKRNQALSLSAATETLNRMLGTSKVLWLEGAIAGDDTDGHIDQLARFVAIDRIVVSVEEDPSDSNYASSQRMLQQLREATDASGRPFGIISLPGPAPLVADGKRLPASYANFYIANETVLVPQFASHRDQQALETLSAVFSDRQVVGIDCSHVIVGLGAIHCVTQQMP